MLHHKHILTPHNISVCPTTDKTILMDTSHENSVTPTALLYSIQPTALTSPWPSCWVRWCAVVWPACQRSACWAGPGPSSPPLSPAAVGDTNDHCYSGTPHLRPPPKSDWGGLKRGVVSREGFATFNTRGRLQRLTSTLGGAYDH